MYAYIHTQSRRECAHKEVACPTQTVQVCVEVGGLTKYDLHSCCDRVGGAEDRVGEGVGVSAGHHPQSEGGLDGDEPRPPEVDSRPVLRMEQETVE